MLKLESLAFFNKSADDVASAINDGNSKQFIRSVNDVLKVANNKTVAPKSLRVIDTHYWFSLARTSPGKGSF